MLKVGITGGIGSGKTTVCKQFEQLGVPIYYADDRAKYLMQHDPFLIDQIKSKFGEHIYEGNQLDKKKLAEIVFNDAGKLALLNSIVHPAVYLDTEKWQKEMEIKKHAFIIKEAALLIETGQHKTLDYLIVVTAPLLLRLSRVSERDQIPIDKVMQRVHQQMNEEEKISQADFIIENKGSMEAMEEEVNKLHKKLTLLSETIKQ